MSLHSHSHEIKPLWLMKRPLLAVEYRDKLIGSVVKHPDLPTERRIPYRTAKQPREMVTDLDPRPVQVHNVKFWTRRIKDAGVSANLNDIMEAFLERARENSSEHVGTVARMWHMDSPGEKFKELLEKREFFEELFELLRGNHDEGYFVTDVVTLLNMEVHDTQANSAGGGAKVNVPIDQTLGLISAGGGAHLQVVREKGHTACFEDEIIVFLGYRKVRLEKVVGTQAKLKRLVLGRKHGFTVRDGMDYWPEMVERPVEGNAEGFMGVSTPGGEGRELGDGESDDEDEVCLGIVDELGFDVEIVG